MRCPIATEGAINDQVTRNDQVTIGAASAMTAENPRVYIAGDRRRALAAGTVLADRVQGSGLFADISGFTPLTETLARELGPQRGAEELAANLNRMFQALISDLDRFGGHVIYFSGDAITCWLDGDDGTRGVAAALAIQETMASAGRVVTPAGTEIILAIKVAIAVGPARRFVVGDPDIQLIDVLGGTIVDALAEAEQLAERGEILLSASALAATKGRVHLAELRRLPTAKGAGPLDGPEAADRFVGVVDALLVDVAETPVLAEPLLPEGLVRPWLLPVVYERLQTGRGEFLTELRSAYPMFVRFGGIDYDDDPDAPAKLDAFVRRAQEVFTRHGGNLLQLTLGDKGAYLYAVFGSPYAHGDDASRAAGAALELRAAAADTAARDLQIGITNGRLISGTYGQDMRRTFTCLGDAVNLSARLMSKAPPGGIYVSGDVRDAAGARYLWDDIGAFAVKGKVEPVAVWVLEGVALRQREREIRYPLPMVGRDAELDVIARAAGDIRGGGCRVVALAAEPGRGKSRLVAEAVRRLRSDGMTVAFGEAPAIGSNSSYAIWREVWRTLLGVEDDATESNQRGAVRRALAGLGRGQVRRSSLLGPLIGIELPDSDLTRTFDAKLRKTSLEALLSDALRATAKREPLAIVLEDCHWIDPLSRDLLEVLVRATTRSPVLFLLAYRPGDHPAGGLGLEGLSQFEELVLEELGPATAHTVAMAKLRQLFGDDVVAAPQLLALVVERSQGNPFYLEELLNYIRSHRIDPADPAQLRDLELPDSLHSLVLSRIDTLAEGPRRTLKVASVLGRGFASPMVQRVYPDLGSQGEVDGHLAAGRGADLVVVDVEADSSWLFRHVLTREVAYQSLPFAMRELLHARAAAELETQGAETAGASLDLITHHWWHSNDRDKKITYLERAGVAAQARYANAAAIDYFERLAGLVDAARRAEVLRKLGKVLELSGSWTRAREVDEEAFLLARAAGDRDAEAWCEASLAEVDRKQGDFGQAQERLDRAAVLFGELHDDAGNGQVLHLAGTVAAQRGDNAGARAKYLASLAVRERLGDRPAMASVLSNLGVVAEYDGDLDAARDYHQRALALRSEIGDRWAIAVSHTNLGMIAVLQGRADAARDEFEEAMRLNSEVGDTWMVALSHNNLGNAHRGLGDHHAARREYADAASVYRQYGDQWALAFLLEDVAVLAAMADMPVVALELMGAADRCHDEVGSPRQSSLDAEISARLAGAISTLDAQSQAQARSRGRAWDTDDAVAAVLRFCDAG